MINPLSFIFVPRTWNFSRVLRVSGTRDPLNLVKRSGHEKIPVLVGPVIIPG
jgi:hypothetical protein